MKMSRKLGLGRSLSELETVVEVGFKNQHNIVILPLKELTNIIA